jgi:SAM-dependent methyltransferase
MSAQRQLTDDYRSLAAYYDLIYAQVGPDDVPFYLEHAARLAGGPEGHSRILELGCGTGRVTLPLARAGHDVTALDLSPAMLEQFECKLGQEPAAVQQRIAAQQGDMRSFSITDDGGQPQGFDLIIAPFRAFQHLLEPTDQRAMLERVRTHLAPGGVYIHDQFEPNYRYVVENMQRGTAAQLDCEIELPDGGLIQRWITVRYDLGRQRLDAQFRVDNFAAGGLLRSSILERIALRLTHRQELLHLLELCGLRVRTAYDGYHGAPLGPELARELVLVCERAE